VRRLGEGSFGVVWQARGPDGRVVALKIMRSAPRDLIEERSFMREVEALLAASHPCLMRLRGWTLRSSEETRPAIVTDFMPNGSIEDILQRRRPIAPTRKAIYLYGIAEGMRYLADELGIVHRDLKPANVMLNADDEPVVGDFGLAKAIDNEAQRQTVQAGSPVYMAPELANDQTYGSSVDVYAYAIMAWEILTGEFAFADCQSAMAVYARVLNGDRPRIPSGLRAFAPLLEQAWDQEAEKRPTFAEICGLFRDGALKLPEMKEAEFKAYVRKIDSMA
jgi:serine/threonine-protein kinase